MTSDQLRDALVEQWDEWRAGALSTGSKATVADAIRFCAHLTRRRSRLLNDCPGGDPWRHVQTVLLDAGAVVAIDPRGALQ